MAAAGPARPSFLLADGFVDGGPAEGIELACPSERHSSPVLTAPLAARPGAGAVAERVWSSAARAAGLLPGGAVPADDQRLGWGTADCPGVPGGSRGHAEKVAAAGPGSDVLP